MTNVKLRSISIFVFVIIEPQENQNSRKNIIRKEATQDIKSVETTKQ